MTTLTRHNHIYANFELADLPTIKQNTEAYEALMWHIVDGIRLYDLWVQTSIYDNGEDLMWQQVTDHLRFRYGSQILNELYDFVCEKAGLLCDAILAITEKDEHGLYVSPLGLGDDQTGDWCKFVVGIGREYYEELMASPEALREACQYKGYAVECFTYAISNAIALTEPVEEE